MVAASGRRSGSLYKRISMRCLIIMGTENGRFVGLLSLMASFNLKSVDVSNGCLFAAS